MKYISENTENVSVCLLNKGSSEWTNERFLNYMDENTFKFKLTVCTSISSSFYPFKLKVQSTVPKSLKMCNYLIHYDANTFFKVYSIG